jgi:phage baseplate assembly protein V
MPLSERDLDAIAERVYHRIRNTSVRLTLHLSDDTQPTQFHQTEGYLGEVRDQQQRYSEFGFSSLPLPGAKAHAVYHGGWRGFTTITGVEDPRYRPTGLNPGEHQLYMVDGAQSDGTGGTTRLILQGLLGWVANLFGITITIGDSTNTKTIALYAPTTTINGDLHVTGAVIAGYGGDDQVNLETHRHGGVDTGEGNTEEPNPQ